MRLDLPTLPTDLEHPIDAMLACHARIQRFLGGARRLAALEDPADPRASDAARQCARYFREGLPLHAEDEDASLAPRLAGCVSEALDAALATMAAQHRDIDAANEALVRALEQVAAGDPVPAALAARVEALAGILEPHLALEEAVVFPAARAALSAEAALALRREMAARRR